jgi:hypothetical protein
MQNTKFSVTILTCFQNVSRSNVSDRLCGLVFRAQDYKLRGPGFDSRYYIFWEVVGLQQGLLSLVRITEERLEWKSSGHGLENRLMAVRIRCTE